MRASFVGKTICILGASVVEHGEFIYNIRSYFHGKKEKCFVYNRGTGGNRAIMAQYILDDEIRGMNPDYVIVTFGANDAGIWLYDNDKPVTEEFLKKRKLRNQEYYLGIRLVVDMLKERGIKPIIMSPYAVNELLIEKEDIKTLCDNKEKEDYIGPSFYTRATFRNINCAFKEYAKALNVIAKDNGVEYIPMFEKSYDYIIKDDGYFWDDGVHYTSKGHAMLAKIILEFFGCTVNNIDFEKTAENDEIRKWEKIERDAGYIRRATPFNPIFGNFEESVIKERAEQLTKHSEQWLRSVGNSYLEYGDRIDELRERIFSLTEKF